MYLTISTEVFAPLHISSWENDEIILNEEVAL
jgi:hypothetical protein